MSPFSTNLMIIKKLGVLENKRSGLLFVISLCIIFLVVSCQIRNDSLMLSDETVPKNEEPSTLAPETIAELATVEAIVAEKPELAQFYSRYCITEGYCGWTAGLGLSPNKEWAVFFNTGKGSGGLSIINVDSKKQQDIFCRDITEDPIGGECTVAIEHWSRDGSYLYISPQRGGDGGMAWFWRDYIQLIRIDLKNETWIDTKMGSAYSFSPNDRFIAYRFGQNVVIHEFLTGQKKYFTVPTEYVSFGRFVWSPDGEQILFIGVDLIKWTQN